jgi:acyl-CoA thioester hydrolase
MSKTKANPVYTYTLTVTADATDQNGHVNNVHYVQWMQDAAVRHYESIGGIPPTEAIGATWVVRSHHIEYFSPAFAGDAIEVRTWVVNMRRVRSLRRYEFVRVSDGAALVKGETDWVFVDNHTGRPIAIPKEVSNIFPLQSDGNSRK